LRQRDFSGPILWFGDKHPWLTKEERAADKAILIDSLAMVVMASLNHIGMPIDPPMQMQR
jgi:hypothetical protein